MLKFYKLYITVCLFLMCATLNAQDTLFHKNWLRFNVQGALIANSDLSNIDYKELHPQYTYDAKYTSVYPNPVRFGFNSGIEFLIGRDKWLKQIVSFSFDLTNSNYSYSFKEEDPHLTSYSYKSDEYTLKSRVYFIDINYGLLISPNKKLKFAPIISFGNRFMINSYKKGYEVNKEMYWSSPGVQQWQIDSTNYTGKKSTSTTNKLIMSLKIRVSYDVTNYLSVFALRNFGISYISPWWMLGVQYYPFRKLR